MQPAKRDPVCGMTVRPEGGIKHSYRDQSIYFCSTYCLDRFLRRPEEYFARLITQVRTEAPRKRLIGYFSMEVAAGPAMPTYSGGLGVLAGDTLKSCADLQVPVVGVSLLYGKGYFDQKLDERGNQRELPVTWNPDRFLEPLAGTVAVEIEGRPVYLKAWQHNLVGQTGYVVPLILLDADLDENDKGSRTLTHFLYGGDERYRFAQEALLGIGGTRMLRLQGYTGIKKFHMNEGHASLLVLELLRESGHPDWDFDSVRERCVFTTHTPVPAGHDSFGYDLVERVLGEPVPFPLMRMLGGQERLNMTALGMNLSKYINGVAKQHGQVSREMFPGYPIHHITNGVHSWTWTCDSFRGLFDRCVPGWSNDPALLRQAVNIPKGDIWSAHQTAKSQLLDAIAGRAGRSLARDALTIGFAHRMTTYKRADLIFTDVQQLLRIAAEVGPLQFVFAGKAHPRDEAGKEMIRRISALSRDLRDRLDIVYLENFDLELARLIIGGVDLWLNAPQPPLEASGTSGMKAAHNGVPSLSTLDGWWIEVIRTRWICTDSLGAS